MINKRSRKTEQILGPCQSAGNVKGPESDMKATMIQIVVGAQVTIANNLVKRLGELKIEGRTQTIEITALLK